MFCERDTMIRVDGLSKSYRVFDHPMDRLKQLFAGGRGREYYTTVLALTDISFSVARGQAVGIVGRNGSGKSTLLEVISGTVAPSRGSAKVQGRVSPLLELGSGFNPEFTGGDNVYLSAAVMGLSRREIDQRFSEIRAFADIGDFFDRPVKTYSSGMFARLAFAVAVHVDPDVLVVDETLSVGDIAFQQKCIQRMFELRRGGLTLLFVSHDPYQVKTVCDLALYLREGRLARFGEAGSVVDAYLADLHSTQGRKEHEHSAQSALSNDAASYRIVSVALLDEHGQPTRSVRTGDTVVLTMQFERLGNAGAGGISFVFNLYRADGLYICGTTTLMDGYPAAESSAAGRVSVQFPALSLLAGRYHWRVAVNDQYGLSVLAKAERVCPFVVEDKFKAVGLVDLPRIWRIESLAVDELVAIRPENAGAADS
jgi:ABC-type polysaccharide/polyol phosphate transport system ATPase subunit